MKRCAVVPDETLVVRFFVPAGLVVANGRRGVTVERGKVSGVAVHDDGGAAGEFGFGGFGAAFGGFEGGDLGVVTSGLFAFEADEGGAFGFGFVEGVGIGAGFGCLAFGFTGGGFVDGITCGEIGGEEGFLDAAEAVGVLDNDFAWGLRDDGGVVEGATVG